MGKRTIRRERRERTPEEKAAYAETARQVEAEFRPGQAVPPRVLARAITLGEYLDLRELVADLRDARQAQGLSLSDVQQRTGLDRAAVSRLETGENTNPTLGTLTRYAGAVGRELRFSLVEREPVPGQDRAEQAVEARGRPQGRRRKR